MQEGVSEGYTIKDHVSENFWISVLNSSQKSKPTPRSIVYRIPK